MISLAAAIRQADSFEDAVIASIAARTRPDVSRSTVRLVAIEVGCDTEDGREVVRTVVDDEAFSRIVASDPSLLDTSEAPFAK